MNALLEVPEINRLEKPTAAPPCDCRDVCDVLEGVIAVLRDSEEGFRHAAQHASTDALRNELMRYSGQRGLFVRELQGIEKDCGREEVDAHGTVSGVLHRAWIRFKAVLEKCEDKALLEEAARGEQEAARAYEEALTNHPELPPDVRHCLFRQSVEIQKGHCEISSHLVGCPR